MYIDAHAHLDKYGPELPISLKDIQQHVFTVSVSTDIHLATGLSHYAI